MGPNAKPHEWRHALAVVDECVRRGTRHAWPPPPWREDGEGGRIGRTGGHRARRRPTQIEGAPWIRAPQKISGEREADERNNLWKKSDGGRDGGKGDAKNLGKILGWARG